MSKPTIIQPDQEFVLNGTLFKYSVSIDGAIQLTKLGAYDGKVKSKFIPPSPSDVQKFFAEKGYTEASAIKAWQYYDVAEWKDSKGNQVKNWKQKMMGVWFKDENKIVDKKDSSDSEEMIM
jgi:hypothetical protein